MIPMAGYFSASIASDCFPAGLLVSIYDVFQLDFSSLDLGFQDRRDPTSVNFPSILLLLRGEYTLRDVLDL